MTDEALAISAVAVVGVQLAAPLILGIPALRAKTIAKRDAKAGNPAAAAPVASAPRVGPLHCPACSAPVPLADAAFACPFCHAEVRPPEDYVRIFALRRQAIAELARAERLWRASRFTGAWPLVWLFRLLVLGWSGLVLLAVAMLWDGWPHMVLWLAMLMAVLQILVGLALASAFADMRKLLPPLPAAKFMHAPAEAGTCGDCGAPVRFEADRLAATCGYCGADAYRAGLAQASRADAQAQESHARTSLRESAASVRERRTEVLGFFGILAVAEIFYGGLLVIATVYNFIFGGA